MVIRGIGKRKKMSEEWWCERCGYLNEFMIEPGLTEKGDFVLKCRDCGSRTILKIKEGGEEKDG